MGENLFYNFLLVSDLSLLCCNCVAWMLLREVAYLIRWIVQSCGDKTTEKPYHWPGAHTGATQGWFSFFLFFFLIVTQLTQTIITCQNTNTVDENVARTVLPLTKWLIFNHMEIDTQYLLPLLFIFYTYFRVITVQLFLNFSLVHY